MYRSCIRSSRKGLNLKGNSVEVCRDGKWTESVAVGREAFVTSTKEKLGVKVKGREVIVGDGSYVLRESPEAYVGILGHENEGLRLENTYFWDDNL